MATTALGSSAYLTAELFKQARAAAIRKAGIKLE
jgi:hypothetical protein